MASAVEAQSSERSLFTPAVRNHPAVRDAVAWLERSFEHQVEEWVRITEIPANSGQESARASYIRSQMERAGLEVSIDDVGNVTGLRRGVSGESSLVFAAHMDTVHPQDTDISVSVAGDTLKAPGVFDNSASVANMLAAIRALNAADVQTSGDIYFVATAQEELGLVGMNHWLDSHQEVPDMLVALDGGLGTIAYGALGVYWTRYVFTAQGSHTLTSTGKPHPARALADAIRSIYELHAPPDGSGVVFNVGMVGAGEVVNAIPRRAHFTVDLRTVDPALLDSLDAEIGRRVQAAAEAQSVGWSVERIQQMPAGGTADDLADRLSHPLVATAVDIYRTLGLPSRAVATGSTDGNAGVARGIPTIAVGRSYGGNQHTLAEWADTPSALPATKAVVLLAVSLAGLAGDL